MLQPDGQGSEFRPEAEQYGLHAHALAARCVCKQRRNALSQGQAAA